MTIIAYPIPNLINGVSQQAPQQRRDTQCEAQTNCINSPVDGCEARPGSTHVAFHSGEDFTGAAFHDVIRSDDEKYRVVIKNGALRVFDILTGAEGTITADAFDTEDYLDTTGVAEDSFRFLTIEDTTFVANTEIVPEMIPYTAPAPSSDFYDAFIYFRAGDYRATYAFYVRWGSSSYRYYIQTPDGTLTDSSGNATGCEQYIRTTYLANQLYNLLLAGQGSNPPLPDGGFTVTLMGNIIRVRRSAADLGDFKVDGYDDSNGEKMLVIKDSVKRFAQLPDTCWTGTILKVAGTATSTTTDDYWVKWTGNDGTQGVWEECAAPRSVTTINAKSMPHTLLATGGNSYTFGTDTWSTRIAGDGINTAKDPSFIGRPIQDLTFDRNRFGIMTESSISLSKSRQYFTFFPDTVQTILDTAPIDSRLASTHIAILRYAVAHGQNLFFWANGIQFVLDSSDTLTEKTVEIKPTTDFDFSDRVRPRGIGDNLVYTNESGKFSQVFEQFAAEQGVNKESEDITSHVPKYIPSKLRWLDGSTTLNCYIMSSESEPNVLYVYNYFVSGDQKQQSAWDRWVFPQDHNILWGSLDANLVHLCIQRPDGVAFETLDVSPAQVDDGGTYLTRLDRRVTEAACTWHYTPPVTEADGRTTVTLPYGITADEQSIACLVTRPGGTDNAGHVYQTDSVSGNTLVVVGEVPLDAKFFVGFIPVADYTFSAFYPKDDKGAFIYERTQVRYVNITYARTGWTRAVVTKTNGRVYDNVFTGRILGDPANILDGIAITDGTLRVPVKSENTKHTLKLINDSPFPSSWQSSAVDYTPTVRAQRIG